MYPTSDAKTAGSAKNACNLLATKKEPNVLKSILNKIDGDSLNQIANETRTVSLAVLENKINVTARWSQPGFRVSNLRNRTYVAYTYLGENELSCSAMTQGEELLRHPVVEHLG